MLLAFAAAAASPVCRQVPLPQMVANYSNLLKRQDSDHIASLYGATGLVENPGAQPIRGETAIRDFLSGFHGAVVDSSDIVIEQVLPSGDAWRVTGRFHQTGKTPQGQAYDANGSFDSLWICNPAGWNIRKMATGK